MVSLVWALLVIADGHRRCGVFAVGCLDCVVVAAAAETRKVQRVSLGVVTANGNGIRC